MVTGYLFIKYVLLYSLHFLFCGHNEAEQSHKQDRNYR